MRNMIWLVGGLSSVSVLLLSPPGGAQSAAQKSISAAVVPPQPALPLTDESGAFGCSLAVSPAGSARAISACGDEADDAMSQMRSVDELSDVHPSDWAYQSLRTLVERYGVVSGYPDRTFRGNRSISRNEFAAILNRVIDGIVEQYALGQAQINQLREDFATAQRLQASYGTIAMELDDRLNRLGQDIAYRERTQFSTTSRLTGQTVLVLTNGSNAHSTVLLRSRLNLQTNFTPTSELLTQLEFGNNGDDAIGKAQNRRQNLLGTLGLLAGGGGLDYVGFSNTPQIRKLYYSFQPVPDVTVAVGSQLVPRDFIDQNQFANDSAQSFATSFFMNNPLIVQNPIDRVGGAGAAVVWKLGNLPLTLRALYVAADASRPDHDVTDGGLFGDRNQGSVELDYTVRKDLVARLQFTKATINNVDIVAGGINAEWVVNQDFAVFGRFAIGSYNGFNPFLNQNLDLHPYSWSVGFIARQLFIPGSTAGFGIGQPFVENDLGDATQTNVEAFYSFLLNDNISFTPALTVVANPNNRSVGTIWEWLVRLVYSF